MKRYFLFVPLLLLLGCLTDDLDEPSVITEEVIYVSAESFRIVGRVLSDGGTALTHGFEVSESASFDSSVVLDLGEVNGLGRFFTEYNELAAGTKYYVRAFLIQDGNRVSTGNVLEFSTAVTSLISIQPATALVGEPVLLSGNNFTEGVRVFFGDVEAEVQCEQFESRIQVVVPSPANEEFVVDVSVLSGGETLVYDENFEYQVGRWTSVSEFPSEALREPLVIFDANQLIYGMGRLDIGDLRGDVYSLDIDNDIWDLRSSFIFGRSHFVTQNYFGGGVLFRGLGGALNSDDFYTVRDGQISRLDQTPFSLYGSKAFEYENDLYVIGGVDGASEPNMNAWVFDSSENTWSVGAEIPFLPAIDAINFYTEEGFYLHNQDDNFLWKYDFVSDSWSAYVELPILFQGGIGAMIDGTLFVGLSFEDNRIWELDSDDMTFKLKVEISDSPRNEVTGYGTIDGEIYVLRNNFRSQSFAPKATVWKFNPFTL